MKCMKPTYSAIIYNCNLYLSRLDNLKGIYEGSSCEFKYGWKYEYEKGSRDDWISNMQILRKIRESFLKVQRCRVVFDQRGSRGTEQRSVSAKISCIIFRSLIVTF